MNHQHHADVEEMVQTRGGLARLFRKEERKKECRAKESYWKKGNGNVMQEMDVADVVVVVQNTMLYKSLNINNKKRTF